MQQGEGVDGGLVAGSRSVGQTFGGDSSPGRQVGLRQVGLVRDDDEVAAMLAGLQAGNGMGVGRQDGVQLGLLGDRHLAVQVVADDGAVAPGKADNSASRAVMSASEAIRRLTLACSQVPTSTVRARTPSVSRSTMTPVPRPGSLKVVVSWVPL